MRKDLQSQFNEPSKWRKFYFFSAMLPLLLMAQFVQAQFTVEFDVTDPLCYGQPTGSATAIPVGGQPPFDYLWSTGETGPTISNIPAGLYMVTVTDDNNYQVIKNVILVEPEIVNVDLVANECELPIVITATGSGGMPPYTYSWSIPGATGPVVQAPGPGTYCVTMTDQNLCGAVECITVDFDPLDVNVTANDVSCPGEDDGTVQATPNGGSPPYTYLWSNGATTAAQTGLIPGIYVVTVTDAAGCTATGQASVSEPPPVNASINSNNPACVGDTNGTATVFANGGTPPYTFAWSTGASTQSITGLGAGTYFVTVTDANNCSTVAQTTLSPASNITASINATAESCPGENDGSATATPLNGVPPYTYLWSNGMTTQTINNLAPGTYTVTVTDNTGCTAVVSTTIAAASTLDITIASTDVTICDGSDGTAAANVVDGQGPFTYLWSNGATTQTITGLSEGIYSVTVTDVNGCEESASVSIDAPPAVSLDISVNESTICQGENTASALAIVTGGTMPFSFLWSTGETAQEIFNLGPGTYSCTVTDGSGCMDTASVTINAAPLLEATITGQEVVCDPSGSGFATANGVGGTPPYTYEWSTGATTQTINDLGSGTYFVTVTDAEGCTATESITINVVDDFILDIGIQNVLCEGDSTGNILAEGWGGTPPYIYEWSNGETGSPVIENLPAGNYTVTVTDQNGCQLIENFTITEPPLLEVMVNGNTEICPGDPNGTAMAMGMGGTPPYNYLWSNGSTNQMIFNLSAGTYTVTLTDANNCEAVDSITVTASPAINLTVTGTETLCPPDTLGTATATISGGTPPLSFVWSNGETTLTITDLPEGTYSITVTDALGCTAEDSIFIDIVDDFILDIGIQNVLCAGDSTGSILAEGWGGTPPYTYEWSNGQTGTPMIENIPAGNYSVTVTDQNGCELIENFTITEPPLLDVTISGNTVVCPGENGAATAVVSGGTPPYTYLWSTGSTNQAIFGLTPGTYSVTVTDANDCEAVASVTVTESPAINLTVTGTETLCPPDTLGTATASVSGGTSPFAVLWNTGETTLTITDLPEGTYTVTVTDAVGCTAVDSIFIDIVDDFILDIGIQNVLCEGDSTGSILAEGWGGTPPYTYEWSNGQTGTPMIENLPAGNYSVTVTDQNGCQLIENFTITEPPTLVASAIASADVCPGEATGVAMAMGQGGTPPYTYLWSNGATTAIAQNLAAGTYTVTVTDDNNCTAVASVTIEEFDGVTVVIQGTDIVCGPGNTGTATAVVSTGTPPYSYLWSTGATTQTVTGLLEGTVSVTVTDANGCTASDDFSIDIVDDLEITGIVKDVLCFGEASGEVSVTVTGGTAPYTYLWSTGQTTAEITGLAAGTYEVTATDANGCTVSHIFVVEEPTLLTASATADGTVCPGESTGTVTAMGMGGTPPYTYAWSTGDATQTVNNLPAGTYTVTVTDANMCTATAQVTIEESEEVTVTIEAPEIVCGAGNTGSATAEATGGQPPYFYSWSTGESGTDLNQIENLPEGTYFVTVTDANGCTAVEQVMIEVIDDFNVSVSPRDVLCNGGNSGSILLIADGGSMPYTYSWSTGQTTNEIINLTAGTYSYTVTDANNCEISGTVNINEPPLLTVNLIDTDIDCAGDDNGQIVAEVMGGTPPYTYDWSNGEETAIITNLAPGTYTVTITDANFCTATASATITEQPAINITLTANDVLCFGESTGSVTSDVTGGTPPYTYEWDTGANTADLNNVPPGTYILTVTDANNCRAAATATVGEPDELTVSLDIMDIFCDANDTGSITANPTGGTPPYTYEWSNTQTGQTITGLGPGDYTVTVTDLNECTVVMTGTVELFPGLMLTPIASSPNCFGESTGAAAVSIIGGTPPFTYEWDNGATTPELINIPAGVYTVTVTDAVGCRGEETIGIVDPVELVGQISSTQTQDVSCNGGSDGQASVEVTGGTPPLSFDWSNGATTQTVTGLSAGTYEVTITDANGCTDELSVTLDEPTAINVNITLDNANTCDNATDGAATASATGGTGPYTFAWSNGTNGASISNLAAGNYTVTVTDANDCTATATVTISEFPSPTCVIEIVNNVSVAGNDGELTINVTGGTAPFTYQWGGGQSTQSLSGLTPGDYFATVTDANGCETSCSVTLAPPAQIGDFVWNDEDRDGIQDPGEVGIGGVMVILQIPGESDPTDIDTTFTDPNGFYFFNVPPGEYKLTFILPDGLAFADQDQGTDDTIDSDVDPDMGMTDVFIIGPGEVNLTLDAGMFTKCDNIDDPGLIGPNQFLCGPGNDPDPIVNIESPSGGSGQIEYLWMQSTVPGPFNIQTWQIIPGATGPDYDPGPLAETTYFARCARRECCTIYLESNIVEIEVGNVAVAEINGPDFICVDEPTTFFAGPTGANAVISWSFSAGVNPQTATGPQVAIQVGSLGSYTITLTVTENGCTSTSVETINATNSPIYCGGSMGLMAEVEDEEAGIISVSWMVEEFLRDHEFTLEHSANGEEFERLATVESPSALLGVMNYYEYMHESAKRGRNVYRVRIENPQGDVFYSEEAEAILYGDSKIALLYPNPTDDIATLELFETFGEDATAELISANGAIIQTQEADADTKQLQFDLSQLPSGTYFLRLTYSRSGNKVYKLVKR